MTKLLPILFLSFIFSGELEVDGDLTVTGNIQNQTIDSLLQVIQDLQSQIALLGGSGNSEISSRIVEFSIPITASYEETILNINEIIGESQNWYKLSFISAEFSDGGAVSMTCAIEFGVNDLGYDIDNEFASPSGFLIIDRQYNGNIDLGYNVTSNNTFLVSDDIPKFGVKTSHCTINGGGYWTGSLILKFVVESDF